MTLHLWSEEEKEFLRQHYPNHSQKELLKMFNKYFNVAVSHTQLIGALKRYGIKSGRTGHFTKGHKSWNTGKKGLKTGGEVTQFKKGHKPWNYKPVGTERVNGEGYVDVKVADPNVWKAKHRIIWEEANGQIPEDHVLIFADGNRLNVNIENLILISRKQLSIMNINNLIKKDAELTKTGVIIASIYDKIHEIQKAQ